MLPALRQITVSVAASLIASLVFAGVKIELHEWAGHDAAQGIATAPALTSGGKFAARIEAVRLDEAAVAEALPLPPMLPLLAVEARDLGTWQAPQVAADAELAAADPGSTPAVMTPARPDGGAKAVRRVAHQDAKRRPGRDDAGTPVRIAAANPSPESGGEAAGLPVAGTPLPHLTSADQGMADKVMAATRGWARDGWDLGTGLVQRLDPVALLR